MKIHIHTPSFFPSLVGMTYATHVHATMLRELGADVTVVAPASDDKVVAEVTDYCVRRFSLSGGGLPWSPLRGDVEGIMALTAADRPDIVIAEGWFTPGSVLLPRLRPHARHLVLASHGSADLSLKSNTPAQLFRSLSYRWIERREQRRVAGTVSAAMLLSDYQDEDRFRDGRIFAQYQVPTYICPNSSIYAPRTRAVDEPMRQTLLNVGSLTPSKNQLLAVTVLGALPSSFRLTLAFPEWNSYGDQVLETARALGVQDRISFVEGKTRDELEPTFDASGLLLITSMTEAQPIIAADALRKGMPFVSTKVGCMPEFKGGIVTDLGSLTDAVMHICQEQATYASYALSASEYYESTLNRQHSHDAIRTMLEGLN